jgi:hypothetical protein
MLDCTAPLRRLADDCEERARRTDSAEARSSYHGAARAARMAIRMGYAGDMAKSLRVASAMAALARCHEGEEIERVAMAAPPLPTPSPFSLPPVDETLPSAALNARQLALMHGMPERTARRTIERGMRKGRPGFYRRGCHWYAEEQAFHAMRRTGGSGRIVSE